VENRRSWPGPEAVLTSSELHRAQPLGSPAL
jgi:hypothetical protein